MADGEKTGTNGWTRFEWGPWLLIVAVGSLVTLVNTTSELLEAERGGHELAWWKPFTWETTSLVANLALAPFVGEAIRRAPPQRGSLLRFFCIHLALTAPYSLLHVSAMVGLRKAVYAIAGGFYDFTHGALARELFYEWRKDVLVYAMFAAVYYFFRRYEEQRSSAEPPGDDRIEIRDGGAALFLAPSDILFVEAAGNYVEFHTLPRAHLVRGTLAAWDQRLAPRGFIRVHRSRLVNRIKITSLKPTPAGDVEITLTGGRMVLGSRRYRAAFSASAG